MIYHPLQFFSEFFHLYIHVLSSHCSLWFIGYVSVALNLFVRMTFIPSPGLNISSAKGHNSSLSCMLFTEKLRKMVDRITFSSKMANFWPEIWVMKIECFMDRKQFSKIEYIIIITTGNELWCKTIGACYAQSGPKLVECLWHDPNTRFKLLQLVFESLI